MTTFETCKYQFTEAELRELADNLARKLEEKSRTEEEKKEVAAQFSAKIKTLANETNLLAVNVRNRWEYRSIECDVIYDYKKGEVKYVRLDSGEIHRTRVMTAAERQEALDLKDAKKEKK